MLGKHKIKISIQLRLRKVKNGSNQTHCIHKNS